MKKKWDKVPTPWSLTEKVFVACAVGFFLFATTHSLLGFFDYI